MILRKNKGCRYEIGTESRKKNKPNNMYGNLNLKSEHHQRLGRRYFDGLPGRILSVD